MMDLYRAVWRVSGRDQIVLILLSVVVAGLAAVPLKFQQLAINSMVDERDAVHLAWLCGGFLGAVLVSAGFKFWLGLRLAVVGERVVLLIRERLYANYRTSGDGGSGVGSGTLIAMLTSEAEAVGNFAGTAISSPVVQIGTLVSVIGFIAVSQPWLGVLALAVVLPQAAIVLAIQGRINRRVKDRVQALRDASDLITTSDPSNATDQTVKTRFEEIYRTRRRIVGLKLTSKLALGVIRAFGMVGILFVGGWLVLAERSDVGTVVASLSGLARIDGPWRDLVAFFRAASTVRVKYAMLLPAVARPDP